MKVVRFEILLILLIITVLSATPERGREISVRFMADNTEFFNPYVSGKTLLGNSGQVVLFFEDGKTVRLDLGIYLLHWYGEKGPPGLVLPVMRIQYSKGGFYRFVFGNLITSVAGGTLVPHGLHRALLAEDYGYIRNQEYGFQSILDLPFLRHEGWINWNLLNTSSHREYFDFGNCLEAIAGPVRLIVQAYISHHGGQLFQSGPVAENLALLAGLQIEHDPETRFFGPLGASLFWLTDKDQPDRAKPELSSTGYGWIVELFGTLYGFRLSSGYWKGNHFISEEGDALFRTGRDYLFGELKKTVSLTENSSFYFGLRLHGHENKFQYQYRFGFSAAYSR